MNFKITTETKENIALGILKGNIYEIDKDEPIVVDMYKIKVPKKQKGKFRYVLVKGEDGELVD